jgi:hypothetical protein
MRRSADEPASTTTQGLSEARVSQPLPATDEPSGWPPSRRRAVLVAASLWLLVCVALGILRTADEMKAPVRPLLRWVAGIRTGSR